MKTIQQNNERSSVEISLQSELVSVISSRQDRYIVQMVMRNKWITVGSLTSHYQATKQQIISNGANRKRIVASQVQTLSLEWNVHQYCILRE